MNMNRAKKVVIGYDHRQNSKSFAAISAKQFQHSGISVILFSDPLPTPLLSFSVTHYDCDYGIMVTASHNPKQDNGYKVYGRRGCQIVSPEDKTIAAMMASFSRDLDKVGKVVDVDEVGVEEVFENYTNAILKNLARYKPPANHHHSKKIVYTPVHGVGQRYVDGLVKKAGLSELIPVPSQSSPDSNFPTTKFPNPEEGWSVLVPSSSIIDLCVWCVETGV
jgi:phosphomannomutase